MTVPAAARASFGVVLALGIAATATADGDHWEPCPGGDWKVTGADAGEQALVCNGLAAAAGVFARCEVSHAGFGRVRLLETLPVFCDTSAYGLFDAKEGEIRLGRPALCAAEAVTGSLFLSLPMDEAFFALVAHEAAHAFLFSIGLGPERRLEHEYVAGVVQHAVLTPGSRAAALAGADARAPESLSEFNAVILGLAPHLYAAKAWLHFAAQPDGCTVFRALATGAARLPELPDL